jgi:hypothetical protein
MILREGLKNVKNEKLYSNVSSEQSKTENYLLAVANLCSTKIWGSDHHPRTWRVTYDQKE